MRTTQAGPLRWRAGAGWLMLAGGNWREGETDEIDTAALSWANLDRPVAVLIGSAEALSEGEALLEYYADLGGPSGYVLPILDAASARQVQNCQLLDQAGLIHVADHPDSPALARMLQESPALDALARSFEDGAVVIGTGASAAAFGAWIAGESQLAPDEHGWGWLPELIVDPFFVKAEKTAHLQALLNAHPDCLGLGIPEGTALALGPRGQVVTVGPGQVTVVVSHAHDNQAENS